MINHFKGKNTFLSNFYTTYVNYDGMTYSSAESAFQAAKLKDTERRKDFLSISPLIAHQEGQRIALRDDWDLIKDTIMYDVCKAKFSNPDLKKRLLATGDEEIQNTDKDDPYWGIWEGRGENKLGKILMKVREEYRKTA